MTERTTLRLIQVNATSLKDLATTSHHPTVTGLIVLHTEIPKIQNL